VVRADGAELTNTACLDPPEEAADRDGIGRARVGVADIGGEESMNRSAAASPRSATIAGTTIVAVVGAMTVSAAAVFPGATSGGSASAI
jgi:hypothetical protein